MLSMADKVNPQKNQIIFFDSFEEVDKYNEEYYNGLTDDQRTELGLELMQPYYEAYPRLERIYRTAELGECPVSADRWMGD